jgi:hypothetical protein
MRKLRAPVRERFHRELQDALGALDSGADPAITLPIEMSPTELWKMDSERRALARARARRQVIARGVGLARRVLGRQTWELAPVHP